MEWMKWNLSNPHASPMPEFVCSIDPLGTHVWCYLVLLCAWCFVRCKFKKDRSHAADLLVGVGNFMAYQLFCQGKLETAKALLSCSSFTMGVLDAQAASNNNGVGPLLPLANAYHLDARNDNMWHLLDKMLQFLALIVVPIVTCIWVLHYQEMGVAQQEVLPRPHGYYPCVDVIGDRPQLPLCRCGWETQCGVTSKNTILAECKCSDDVFSRGPGEMWRRAFPEEEAVQVSSTNATTTTPSSLESMWWSEL